MKNLKRAVVVAAVSMTAATGFMAGTASAATERVCSGSYFCNETVGEGTYVQYVVARRGAATLGKLGFFEVFNPAEAPRTGPTNTAASVTFPIRKSYQSGGRICLRFFENVAGKFVERGTAACATTPIG